MGSSSSNSNRFSDLLPRSHSSSISMTDFPIGAKDFNFLPGDVIYRRTELFTCANHFGFCVKKTVKKLPGTKTAIIREKSAQEDSRSGVEQNELVASSGITTDDTEDTYEEAVIIERTSYSKLSWKSKKAPYSKQSNFVIQKITIKSFEAHGYKKYFRVPDPKLSIEFALDFFDSEHKKLPLEERFYQLAHWINKNGKSALMIPDNYHLTKANCEHFVWDLVLRRMNSGVSFQIVQAKKGLMGIFLGRDYPQESINEILKMAEQSGANEEFREVIAEGLMRE